MGRLSRTGSYGKSLKMGFSYVIKVGGDMIREINGIGGFCIPAFQGLLFNEYNVICEVLQHRTRLHEAAGHVLARVLEAPTIFKDSLHAPVLQLSVLSIAFHFLQHQKYF